MEEPKDEKDQRQERCLKTSRTLVFFKEKKNA